MWKLYYYPPKNILYLKRGDLYATSTQMTLYLPGSFLGVTEFAGIKIKVDKLMNGSVYVGEFDE